MPLSRLFPACLPALAAVLLWAPWALAQDDPATPVEVIQVRQDTVVQEATAVGTLVSNESVMIRPEIAGRIVEIGFEEGGRVDKGQLLFKLDDSIYQAELADSRARLELARRNLERARELAQRGAGTKRALDQAEAEYQTSQAAVQLARARLTKTTIEAPIEGITGLRQVSVGDYVTVGEDMVNLEDIVPIKVDFRIPERFLGPLGTGQRVRVLADAFPEREFTGEVYAINPQIDPSGRSIHVRARLANDEGVLRPGQFVRVKLELSRNARALLVPEQAIVPRGQARYVYKVVDGKAVETEVEVGQRRFGEAELLSGVEAGDLVVTAGQMKIRDGAAVTALNWDLPADDGGQGS